MNTKSSRERTDHADTGAGEESEIIALMVELGVLAPGEAATAAPLTGGVSSDIWRVSADGRAWCLKRALPRLKVAQVWEAPVERNTYEWRWLQAVAGIDPALVPAPVAHDSARGVLVMAYLAPEDHPLWKTLLLEGHADPAFAEQVGTALARIHVATAGRTDIAKRFHTDHIIQPIRLEPYLLATGRAHPDLAPYLEALAVSTLATKRALVHGDVSPKNILAGPDGPVFLDAECAWYGDPAFDLAFCLNHLLLKALPAPTARPALAACFRRFVDAYLTRVDWEPAAVVEARAAQLLPALFLARVDGKSPVEYVTDPTEKDLVRATARPLIEAPPTRLSDVLDAWTATLRDQAAQ